MPPKKKPRVNLAQPIQPRTGDLEKLFSTEQDTEHSSGLTLLALRVDAIDPDPDQPRSTFAEESLRELAESIRQDGVIQPIEVTETDTGRYMIVHGERRWRAAQLAGLGSVPAVVRRRAYDDVTRFVRQVVENIQREDLNDVDRAAALLRLRQLMQEELNTARETATATNEAAEPWGGRVTWAKVGGRLGYSRQRIHQLIQLLDLPDEIKDAVRDGTLSERETRVYQGLTVSQQRALHRARMAGEIDAGELKTIARLLREMPEQTVSQSIRLLRQADKPATTQPPLGILTPFPETGRPAETMAHGEGAVRDGNFGTESIIPARTGRPTSIERLDWVRGHLARVDRQGLAAAERQEMLRLLKLIQQDVASLMAALRDTSSDDF